jgi:hypothetical protein
VWCGDHRAADAKIFGLEPGDEHPARPGDANSRERAGDIGQAGNGAFLRAASTTSCAASSPSARSRSAA